MMGGEDVRAGLGCTGSQYPVSENGGGKGNGGDLEEVVCSKCRVSFPQYSELMDFQESNKQRALTTPEKLLAPLTDKEKQVSLDLSRMDTGTENRDSRKNPGPMGTCDRCQWHVQYCMWPPEGV